MIIGLTGTNAAGKSTILNLLKSKSFECHSLSDIIRDELIVRGLELSRINLVEVGNELRENFGPSILAERIKTKIKDKNAVIDSIRNPAEIESLKSLKHFILIAIDAPVEIRYQRALKRGRIENVSGLEDFINAENREKSSINTRQNLSACIELADYTIFNNGSISQFKLEMEELWQKIKK